MRELTSKEIAQVSGGSIGDWATEAGAAGTIGGAIVTNTIRGAIIGGGFGALLGATMGVGWYAGSALYDRYS